MAEPRVLLLDGPFMGLDPRSRKKISNVLEEVAKENDIGLVISLDAEETIPKWIQHTVVVDENFRLVGKSRPNAGVRTLLGYGQPRTLNYSKSQGQTIDGLTHNFPPIPTGEPLVEMQGVKVSYGSKTVLGDWSQTINNEIRPGLWWSLHRGQRCGIFGANGSGKTTMLSLITSDHPQTYSLPIKLFGRSRLPGPGEPGISVFDLQKRMGHSSPEVHSFFPKRLSVRRALESAWADAPLAKPQLTAEIDRKVNASLRWFEKELNPAYTPISGFWERMEFHAEKEPGSNHHKLLLRVHRATHESANELYEQLYEELLLNDADLHWADRVTFGELDFAAQRLVLFLRAIIASPDLVILDEAFSGMNESMKTKALTFLSHGEKCVAWNYTDRSGRRTAPSLLSVAGLVVLEGLKDEQALLVISHAREDVPGCVREWICLPDPGEQRPPRVGKLEAPLGLEERGWEEIWGTK